MNLKVLFMILIYYTFLSVFFLFGASEGVYEDFDINASMNNTELTEGEVDTGGLFGTGVSFGRFTMFLLMGIGLGSTVPTWFVIVFAFWQILLNILIIGWIINSIWSG